MMLIPMVYSPIEDSINSMFSIGFVLNQAAFIIIGGAIPGTIMSKICNEKARGLLFFWHSIFASVGILFIMQFGSYLFDTKGYKSGPMIVSFIGQVVYFLLTLYSVIRGKMI
mmetsp:Transcript_32282/g.49422  ORF Transcript_32282/g.49422 Transcript_32282/m.49422 type:complete len:112 (-) Transcript_32282:30-365(-)